MDSKSKEIVVEINREEIINKHPLAVDGFIIRKLKNAGIPIIGVLLFQGISSGTLIQEEKIDNDSYIFRWRP